MEQKDIKAIADTWQLDIPSDLGEEDIIRLLAKRVELLIARDMENFFQAMYRLDIPEARLYKALYAANPPDAVARLIWLRQWEKAKSRKENRTTETPDDDLKW